MVRTRKPYLERDGLKWRESLIKTALELKVSGQRTISIGKRGKHVSKRMILIRSLAQTATWTKLGDARWGEGGRKTDSGQAVWRQVSAYACDYSAVKCF